MSPSAQLKVEQLNEIIEDERKTDQEATVVQEQVEDGEEALNPDNRSWVLNSVLGIINNKFEPDCLDKAVRLGMACLIRHSHAEQVPGNKHSIAGLLGTKFVAHQDWAIWFSVRRWIYDSTMPGALVADEMGLGRTFTSVAVAMICKLLTE